MNDDPSALTEALRLIDNKTLSVDSSGQIWRHAIVSHGQARAIARRRAETPGGNGYLRLMLWINGRLRGVGAHRVVWTHLKGPIPDGLQINHKDTNKQNNRPSNLEPTSGAENIQHSYANGRRRPWSEAGEWRPGRKRLLAERIEEARRLRRDGTKLKDIAARLGIAISHAHRITG